MLDFCSAKYTTCYDWKSGQHLVLKSSTNLNCNGKMRQCKKFQRHELKPWVLQLLESKHCGLGFGIQLIRRLWIVQIINTVSTIKIDLFSLEMNGIQACINWMLNEMIFRDWMTELDQNQLNILTIWSWKDSVELLNFFGSSV